MHRTATQINDGRASEPVNVSYGREKQKLFVCSPLIQLGYTRTYDGIAQPRQRVILGATIKSQGNVVHRTKMDGRVRTLEPTYGPPTYGPISDLEEGLIPTGKKDHVVLGVLLPIERERRDKRGETGVIYRKTAPMYSILTAQAYSTSLQHTWYQRMLTRGFIACVRCAYNMLVSRLQR